jgi:hypothetical protein
VGTGIGPRGQTQVSSLEFRGFRVWGSVSSLPGEKKKGKTLQEGMVLTCTDSHGPQFLHGLVQESAAVCS